MIIIGADMDESVNYSRIMVATDGSECSVQAGRHAIYLAKKLGATVFILNVVDTDMAFHSGIHYAEGIGELEKSGTEATARIKALCDERGVSAREIVVRGTPAVMILKVAIDEQADLIVMGTVGMSAIERALIGSVSDRVMRNASCPVLLVKG